MRPYVLRSFDGGSAGYGVGVEDGSDVGIGVEDGLELGCGVLDGRALGEALDFGDADAPGDDGFCVGGGEFPTEGTVEPPPPPPPPHAASPKAEAVTHAKSTARTNLMLQSLAIREPEKRRQSEGPG